jgi:hypothetical protein
MYLRKIFLLEKIYFKQTAMQILTIYGMALVAVFIALTLLGPLHFFWAQYAYGVIVLVYSYLLIRTIVRTVIVNLKLRKSSESTTLALEHHNKISINNELDKIDGIRILEESADSRLYHAIFNFYTQTKYGDYLSKQAYYTVFEIRLDRQLPRILFDSKSAKRRQFKYMYLKSQKISVQGHFDDYFDTYTPQTYHIDSLSFITPEVMELLIEAKDYDIEIADDRLVICGPLANKARVEDIKSKGRALAERINRNIDTYKDNRLPGAKRHNEVTVFGRSLLKSPLKSVLMAVLLGIMSAIFIGGSIGAAIAGEDMAIDILFNNYSILVYILFVTNLYKALKIKSDNDKAIKQFHALNQVWNKTRR